MKPKSFEYCGFYATGQTLTEAKAKATEKAQAALTKDYSPEIIAYKGVIGVLWVEPHGFRSNLVKTNENTIVSDAINHGMTMYQSGMSREDAKQALLIHVIQTAWTPSDGFTVPEILKPYPRLVMEFESWVRFQLNFQQAKKAGYDETDSYNYAAGFTKIDLPEFSLV